MCASLIFGCEDEQTETGQGMTGGAVGGTSAETGGASGGTSTETGGTLGGDLGGMTGDMSCASDPDCPPGTLCDLSVQICRVGCNSDVECGSGRTCRDHFCESLMSCADGAVCTDGYICSCDMFCVPKIGNECQGNLQCNVNEYCHICDAQCKPKVAPCEPCADSMSCERRDDLCTPVGAQGQNACLRSCTGQGACDNLGPGYRCEPVGEETYCVPSSGSCEGLTQCMSDGECIANHFCNDRLQCQPGCLEDTSCPDGQLCQGLRCTPPCMSPSDCFQEGAICEEGRCRIPGGCQSSRDCNEAETYCDLDQLRCVSGCQTDDDCLDATKECIAGRCRPRGCGGNYQCAFGEVCDLESAQCVRAEGRHCEADCDPQAADTSCGETGQRCLSLQDEEENPLGDYCFEPCQPEPNECPQGYQCMNIEDPNAGEISLCIRRCDLNPVGQ